jgi:hypothetical protein
MAHAERHSRQVKSKVLSFAYTYQGRNKHQVKVKNALRIKVSISNMLLSLMQPLGLQGMCGLHTAKKACCEAQRPER